MTRKKEIIDKRVAALMEQLLARIDSPAPLLLPDGLPEPLVEVEDWSLDDVSYLHDAAKCSTPAKKGSSSEPVSGRRAITIRVPNRVLRAFHIESEKTGTAYQTLMNRVLEDAIADFT